MALVASEATDSSRARRAFSLGPIKVQLMTYTVGTGITTGTVTATGLAEVNYIAIDGLVQTAAPTYSGNVATLTFADPGASIVGDIMIFGI